MKVWSAGSSSSSHAAVQRDSAARRSSRVLLGTIAGAGLLAIAQAAAQQPAGAALAQDSDAATAQAAVAANVDKEEKICKTEVVTGSRMKKRICHTAAQWEARERAAKDAAREIDAKPVGKIGEGPGKEVKRDW